MEVGFIYQGKRCFSNNMDPSKIICFPPFCANRSSLDFAANYPSLANTVMLSATITNHSANTIASTKNSEPFNRSKQRKGFLDRTGKLTTPGMDSLRERLLAESVS